MGARDSMTATGFNQRTIDEFHAKNGLGVGPWRDNLLLMHTCSTYPSQYSELNLKVIPVLKERYNVPVGYSGHETGIPSSAAAVALGAKMAEKKSLDRSFAALKDAADRQARSLRS